MPHMHLCSHRTYATTVMKSKEEKKNHTKMVKTQQIFQFESQRVFIDAFSVLKRIFEARDEWNWTNNKNKNGKDIKLWPDSWVYAKFYGNF